MSLLMEVMRHRPTGFFVMDDTTPLQDYSPYNLTATYTGTPNRHPALVHGATYAPVLKTGAVATFECPVFTQGKEKDSFSLMATVNQTTNAASGPIQVLGHTGQYDGIVVDGTKVSFSTKYLTQGEAKCTYDIQSLHSVDVIGVHTKSKNMLYVDGVMVAEVNITSAQRSDTFIATDGNLYSGQTTTSRGIAVNAIGYFSYALNDLQARLIHNESRRVPSSKDVTPMFGGERLALSREASDIFAHQTWNTNEDWYAAQLSGTAVRNGQLVPQFSAGVSLPSKWYDTFVMTAADTNSIYGVNLDWAGEGATVDVSLNGTTWVNATKGVNVSIIPPGFDPTDKELLIRVSFPGGVTNDTSYISNLEAIGIRTAVSPTWSGRTLTFSNAFQQKDTEGIQLDYNWGTKVNAGGTITIAPDTNTQGVTARSIEVWIRADDVSAAVNITGTYYQDGVSATATLTIGEWTLFHIVPSAVVTGNIIVSGAAQVGQVGLYSQALTAADVAEIANAYAGSNTLRVSDNSPIAISESPTSAQIYAHDWSILSSG